MQLPVGTRYNTPALPPTVKAALLTVGLTMDDAKEEHSDSDGVGDGDGVGPEGGSKKSKGDDSKAIALIKDEVCECMCASMWRL